MKFFFKKQLDFEQKYGTDETVAAVKQKAVAYVEARESFTWEKLVLNRLYDFLTV